MGAVEARMRIEAGVSRVGADGSTRWLTLLRELRTNEKTDARAEMLKYADELGDTSLAHACRSASAHLDPNGPGPDPIASGRD